MNIFEHFKVNKSHYDAKFQFDEFYFSEKRSSINDIWSVIQKLIPRKCGIELIRLGGSGDGGYLVPNDLDGIEALFSPGVNNFKNFEDYLCNEYRVKSFMCDFTSDIGKFKTPMIEGMQFFEKKWLDTNGDKDSISLNNWVELNTSETDDLILQMDIEGAEYRNLLHASQNILKRFRIIIVELHGLRHLWKDGFLNGILSPIVNKLSENFICVHAHPNNCCGVSKFENIVVPNVMELTFLRNDRIGHEIIPIHIPNKQDKSNVPSKPPIYLTGEWLMNSDINESEKNMLKDKISWLEIENIRLINKMR